MALDVELHADTLRERGEAVLHAASGQDTAAWSDDDFDLAISAVAKAYDDLTYAQVLCDVADALRLKTFEEGR